MTERPLPERWKHWEDREGLVFLGTPTMRDACNAVIRSVPTMHHAVRLIAAVRERLGAIATLDEKRPAGEPALVLRDDVLDGWVVPTALLDLAVAGGSVSMTMNLLVAAAPGAKTAPPPVAPDILPTGPEMRAGSLTIHDGAASFTIEYDERGVGRGSKLSHTDALFLHWYTTKPFVVDPLTRPPGVPPIGILTRNDLPASGYSAERAAEAIAEMASSHAPHVPARVLVPPKCPFYATGALVAGIGNLRRVLFDDVVPPEGGYAVIDAHDGTAIAIAATKEEAVARWRDELFRKKPRLPEAPPVAPTKPAPPEKAREYTDDEGRTVGLSTGTLTLTLGDPNAKGPEWPAAIPANIPGLLVPVPPLPTEIPEAFVAAGFRRWKRLLSGDGTVRHALMREDRGGFTLVGEGILDVVLLETLDDEMNARDAREADGLPDDFPNPWRGSAEYPVSVVHYAGFDGGRRRRMPLDHAASCFAGGFSPGMLNRDELAWLVTRVRGLG